MRFTLRIRQKNQDLFSRSLTEGVYRIGRSEFCDISIPHDALSRSHAEIRIHKTTAYITNMGSPGGIQQKGKFIETAQIQDQDEFDIGPYQLVFIEEMGEAISTPLPTTPSATPTDSSDPLSENLNNNLENRMNASVYAEEEMQKKQTDQEAQENQENNFPQNFPQEAPPPNLSSNEEPEFVPHWEEQQEEKGSKSLPFLETQIDAKPLYAKIIFTEGPKKGEEIPIQAYEIKLGRSKKADVYINDNKLSRIHCKIIRVGNGYRLMDIESRHGTYVNGIRILEHPLSSFDQIQVGKSKFRFLIYDMMIADLGGKQLSPLADNATQDQSPPQQENTKSIQLQIPITHPHSSSPVYPNPFSSPSTPDLLSSPPTFEDKESIKKKKIQRIRLIALGALLVALCWFLVQPSENKQKTEETTSEAKRVAPITEKDQNQRSSSSLPPDIPELPKEYYELKADLQRMMEGSYHAAIKAAEANQFENAVSHLRKIHDYIPFYKDSKERLEEYTRRLKEQQILEAQEKAKRDEKKDLEMYLAEGQEFLKAGNFEKAAEAFNSATLIDPNNITATKGMKAAEMKVKSVDELPPEKDPEADKKKMVETLLLQSKNALTAKMYLDAITLAEKIREIEIKSDTTYLNEAKQIIDQATAARKQTFETDLIQAKEKFAEGDYKSSRSLCEEMLRRDPGYEEAKECFLRSKKKLNQKAKEAYIYGYILESMNRLEEAKQYWNKAKNFIQPGDEYFDKVNKKLEHYE